MSSEAKTLFSGTALGLSGPLRVEILVNGMTARLTQPFRVRTGAGRIIEVPAGFETDFASVPRLFWRMVPPLSLIHICPCRRSTLCTSRWSPYP